MIRPEPPAIRRNAYWRMFGLALLVVSAVLVGVRSARRRRQLRPPAI